MPGRAVCRGMVGWTAPSSPCQADTLKSLLMSSGYWARREKTGTEKCLFSHLLLLTFPPSMWYSKMWNQSSGGHHCTRGRGLRRILFPRSVCTPGPVTLRWRPNRTLDWESPVNQCVQYLGPNSGCGLEMKWGACRQRIYWRAPWILF